MGTPIDRAAHVRATAEPRSQGARRDLTALPKVHLHLHLIGSMRPRTLADLARRNGECLPAELSALTCRVSSPPTTYHGVTPTEADVRGFARFDALYVAAKRQVRGLDDLGRLVGELAADEADAGSRWVEVTANPSLYHGRLGPDEAVLEALLEAGRLAQRTTGVGVGWVVSADRRFPDRATSLAELAVRYAGDGVVGFGLANDEAANPTTAFGPAFDIARDRGLLSVPHAGELTDAADIVGAVDRLGADRIGHGIRAITDRRVLEQLVDRQVCLEVCPASNVALGAIDHLAEHPLPQLLATGCAVTLAADDPLLFGSGLADQYLIARRVFGLDDAELAELARCGIRAAGCPPHLRDELLAEVDDWLADVPADAAA
ncbi:MAG TPA: adenosine deaminase [Euzebyales bacterium]|nr:adenosine deaminase [Euzebyales bacterium]